MVRKLVVLAAFVFLVVAPPKLPAAPLSKDAASCQATLAKGLAGFKKTKIKAWSKCLDNILKGKPCDTAARDAAIAAAITRANSAISGRCTDALLFTAQPNGVGFAADCHLEGGALEPYEQGCFSLPVTNTSQLAACLICWKEGEIYEWLKILYPCLQGTVPSGSDLDCGTAPGTCPTDKATIACLTTISKAGTKWLLGKEKTLEKCLNSVRSGKISGPCPDAASASKLTKVAQKTTDSINGKCPSLPPWWNLCPEDSSAPCDQTIASVTNLRDCVVNAGEEIVDEMICWQYPGAGTQGISCPAADETTTTTTATTTSTTTTLPVCGDGFVGGTEQCDPPCGAGCGGGQMCNSNCQCVPQAACSCGTPDPTMFGFTTSAPVGTPTGSVTPALCFHGANNGNACTTDADCSAMACIGGTEAGQTCPVPSSCPGGGVCAAGVCRGHLDRGGLYFGGSQDGVPLPATVPDYGTTQYKACCSGTNLTLAAKTSADTGSNLNCSAQGCLYGAPLPIPNSIAPDTSTCLLNVIAKNATGSGVCTTGDVTLINLPLTSNIHLTGDILDHRCGNDSLGTFPGRVCLTNANCRAVGTDPGTCLADPDLQPCPICNTTTGVCNGGDNDGDPCTPGVTPATPGVDFPTSHDCPPPPAAKVGALPIAYALTTGTASKNSVDQGTQPNVFCGFCRRPDAPTFKRPPVACSSDADCAAISPFTACAQRNRGAFDNALATNITEVGSPAGDMTDHASHVATLVSVFCIPPSYNAIVDPSADIAGPGAVSLPGSAQIQ